jgi:AcrR family transcriptional regulator
MRPTSKKTARTDGRRQRSEASRERIVQAMLELIRAGDVSPRAEEVAGRAGVGLRTVFRHFDNMESLYRQLDSQISGDVMPIVELPLSGGSLPSLLKEMMDRRARIFERIMPFKIAADVHRHASPFLERQMAMLTRAQREMMVAILPAPRRMDADFIESLDLLMSFDTWRRLRKDQKLSVPKARRVLERLVQALVGTD